MILTCGTQTCSDNRGQHLARNNQNCLKEHVELCITNFPEESSVLIFRIAMLTGMLERPLLCFYYFIQKCFSRPAKLEVKICQGTELTVSLFQV